MHFINCLLLRYFLHLIFACVLFLLFFIFQFFELKSGANSSVMILFEWGKLGMCGTGGCVCVCDVLLERVSGVSAGFLGIYFQHHTAKLFTLEVNDFLSFKLHNSGQESFILTELLLCLFFL